MASNTSLGVVPLFFALWSWYLGAGTSVMENHARIGNCTFIVLPVCPDPSIKLYLYTRQNPNEPQLVTVKNITNSFYTKSLPNKFFLHGFNSNSFLNVLQTIKEEYLKWADVNVWMIDYQDVSDGPAVCYLAAVYNLPAVGKCAAMFVRKIMELSTAERPEEVMHVIGFSLGGQLASQLAGQLKPVKLARITGLDPAFPLYFSSHLNRRLSRNDAKFVDIIHTNVLVQGQVEPCGDVDFYVNGGLAQPSCKNSSEPMICNHLMAPTYFAESINSIKGFWSWPCSNVYEYLSGKCPRQGVLQLLGQHVNQNARGQYVLHANSESPYAQGNGTIAD